MEAEDDKVHHIFGPSGAERHLNCPGSLIPHIDKEAGDAAKEGTACHKLLELHLGGKPFGLTAEMFLGRQITGDLSREGKPFLVTEEMIDAVQCFDETVRGIEEEYGIPEGLGNVEKYMVHSQIPDDLFGGTCDYYSVGNGVLLIADLKYGLNPVDASSPQLTEYALLVMDSMDEYSRSQITQVVTVIVQPRSFSGSVWSKYEVPPEVLTGTLEKLSANIELYRKHRYDDAAPLEMLHSGKWCRYCSKVGDCPAVLNDLATVIAESEKPTANHLVGQDRIERLIYLSEKEAVIDAFFKTVSGQLLRMAREGATIPGKKIVGSYGNRRWSSVVEGKGDLNKQRNYLARVLHVPGKGLVEHKLKSVKGVETVLRREGKLKKDSPERTRFEELVEREYKGVKLVDESSKDSAITPESLGKFEQELNDQGAFEDE